MDDAVIMILIISNVLLIYVTKLIIKRPDCSNCKVKKARKGDFSHEVDEKSNIVGLFGGPAGRPISILC